jgi:hypothetical protein
LQLLYDPKRVIKLKKNELLNDLRSKLSLKFYETFRDAEKAAWKDDGDNLEFLNSAFDSLKQEIEFLKQDLATKKLLSSDESGKANHTQAPSGQTKQSVEPQVLDSKTSSKRDLQKPLNPVASLPQQSKTATAAEEGLFLMPPSNNIKAPAYLEEDEFDFFEEF